MNDGGRRRVLVLIPTLTGGGAERVVVTLLQHLDRRRFELALAVVDTRDAVFRSQVPEDVEFIDLGCRRVRQALPRLVRLLHARRPDVVLSTLGHLNLALAIVRPLLPRHPLYLARETLVVSQGLVETRRPQWWARAYRWFYHRLDRVICQSGDMRDDLVARFGVPAARTVVIHNPVDRARIAAAAARAADAPPREPGVLALVAAGRLVSQKGFDLLLAALAAARLPDWRLTLLGEGPLRAELGRQAAALGIADRVRFAGFQANPYAHFAAADAFVLSSRYEGFPNVVLEALACGTPVVALPAPGGVHEILDRVPGCIVAEAMGADALAAALERFVPRRVAADAVAPYEVHRIVARYTDELLRPR